MKATPAWISCYLKQALTPARDALSNSESQRMVLDLLAKLLPDLPLDSAPARNPKYVLWHAQELLTCPGNFASKKDHCTRLA